VFAAFMCGPAASSGRNDKWQHSLSDIIGTTLPCRVVHDLFCLCRLFRSHLRDGYCHCHTSAISYSNATSELVSMSSRTRSIRRAYRHNLASLLSAYRKFSVCVQDLLCITSFAVRHQHGVAFQTHSRSATTYASHTRELFTVM
jgi:hypothetical protein